VSGHASLRPSTLFLFRRAFGRLVEQQIFEDLGTVLRVKARANVQAGTFHEQLHDVRPRARAAGMETQTLLRGDETRPALPQSVWRRPFSLGQRELQHERASAPLDDVACESHRPVARRNPDAIAPHAARRRHQGQLAVAVGGVSPPAPW
jgi:hypothetical protein